jgi:hypothetical protein
MKRSVFTLCRGPLTAVTLALVTIGPSACSSLGNNGSAALPANVAPASGSGYTFYKVDYPSEYPNRITGIASNKEIVGVYGNGSTTAYSSFTAKYHKPSPSQSPYPTFVADNYPDAPSACGYSLCGTYMTSIMIPSTSATAVSAGYVVDPNGHKGNLPGYWAVINNAGLWTLIQNHTFAGSGCHLQEIYGIDTEYDAVGFYGKATTSGKCTPNKPSTYTQIATEIQPGETFIDFTGAPGTNPVATGIYEVSTSAIWIVGSSVYVVSGSASGSEGWVSEYEQTGEVYVTLHYPPASKMLSTQIYGVNASGEGVGTYEDSSGNWHGFTVSGLFSGSYAWSKPIDQGDSTDTVVSGIDNAGDICGWYHGGDGKIHGFVGLL